MTDRNTSPAARADIGWIDNADDPRSTVRCLAALAVGRLVAVVYPTPGCGQRADVAADLLAALGKNPAVLRRERLGARGWAFARAWLAAAAVTDLVVDRCHQLPTARLVELAELTEQAGVRLWLVWSSADTGRGDSVITELAGAGWDVERTGPEGLPAAADLPQQGGPRSPAGTSPAPSPWPRLPSVDFPTFRAAARRRLGRADFALVDGEYRAAADRTDRWLVRWRDSSGMLASLRPDLGGALVGWLRDEQLGPAGDPPAALTCLRGTQVALFLSGLLLRWQPGALGPEPFRRLPGDLTAGVAAALTGMGRADEAAPTALSLHLNQPPHHFACWSCGDVAEDGSTLSAPAGHHEELSGRPGMERTTGTAPVLEPLCCETPVVVPRCGRPIVAAHLALRRDQGAADRDPLFVHPTRPGRAPSSVLREAVIRVCGRLGLDPSWLHRSPCEFGADIGLTRRVPGWMTERGLSLFQLDRDVAARLGPRTGQGAPGGS